MFDRLFIVISYFNKLNSTCFVCTTSTHTHIHKESREKFTAVHIMNGSVTINGNTEACGGPMVVMVMAMAMAMAMAMVRLEWLPLLLIPLYLPNI